LLRSLVYGIESYCPPPGSDKQVRFAAQAIKFESGTVLLPREALWLDEYVREITDFPRGKYDDHQVDSTSQALRYLGDLKDSFDRGLSCSESKRLPYMFAGAEDLQETDSGDLG
jgi:phage terminase large subunit-like protein